MEDVHLGQGSQMESRFLLWYSSVFTPWPVQEVSMPQSSPLPASDEEG